MIYFRFLYTKVKNNIWSSVDYNYVLFFLIKIDYLFYLNNKIHIPNKLKKTYPYLH